MPDNLTVDTCVGVRKGCPISFLITACDQAEFSFGGQRNGFHFSFDQVSLRALLMVGAQALSQMEAQMGEQQADGVKSEAPA